MANERRIIELVLKAVGDRELKAITRDLVAMRRAADDSQRALASIQGGLSGAAGWLKGFVGALGVQQIIGWTRAILDAADALDAAAEQAGIGVERYQTLKEAFRALEVDGAKFETGMERLATTLSDVLAGETNAATKALDRLGITAKIASGEIATTDELVDALANSQKALSGDVTFTSEMVEILGRKLGVDYANALKNGRLETAEMTAAMAQFGVVTEAEIAKLAAAAETVDQFKTRAGNAILSWSAEAITAFQTAGENLSLFLDHLARGQYLWEAFLAVSQANRVRNENARLEAMASSLPGQDISKLFARTPPVIVPRNPPRAPRAAGGGERARPAEDNGPLAATTQQKLHAAALRDVAQAIDEQREAREAATQAIADQVAELERARRPAIAYAEEIDRLNKLQKEGGLSADAYALAVTSAAEAQREANRALVENSDAWRAAEAARERQREQLDLAREQWGYLADAMGQATYDIISGTEKIGQAVKRMVAAIVAEFIRLQLVKLATKFLSGPFPGISFSAAGNAFGGAGIISVPTAHGIRGGGIGIAGEAGPEAILPLQRNASGQLGVAASGGGLSVVVNNNVPGAAVQVRETDRGLQIDLIERQLADRVRRGGSSLPSALENTYRTGRQASAF